MVNAQGTSPVSETVQSIVAFLAPASMDQLRCNLGMLDLYHRFLPIIVKVLHPLSVILAGKHKPKNQCITFTLEATQAFAK